MKKIISVLLTVTVLLGSFLSFNVFAVEPTKTETLFAKIEASQEVAVTLKAGDVDLFGFLRTGATDTIYIKGNKIAYDYDLKFISVRAIYDSKDIYGIIPSFPFFYVKMDDEMIGEPDIWELLAKASDIALGVLNFKGSYTETIDGTEYYVEEFDDGAQVTSKFYYIGDELKILDVKDAQNGSTNVTYFESISFTVDDSVFEIPAFAFDVTPVLRILIASLMADIAA